ncbi:MAG: FHA domain-containing protein [Myxococcales bacterium]|nr:FHA domain-containing protein [Myxococcales bacterium]
MRLSPGRWLNAQLHLLSWLGEDLHGESFLAEQRPQGRTVVVKVLSSEACRTSAFIERFRRSAERAMLLNHRHAAAVHAFGVLPASADSAGVSATGFELLASPPGIAVAGSIGSGIPWLATDPLDGPDLRSYLSEGATPDTLAALLSPVADVLDRAAALGLVHGELMPSSIVLEREGEGHRAVLIDLGLAKVQAADLLDVPAPPFALSYRSPEQCADGQHVESASDRYALAVLLFEAVAGRPPFVAENPRALLQLHRSAPVPPLRTIAAQVQNAEALDAFFVRALAKEPAARFVSATAMLEEFTLALSVGQKPQVRPAQRRRSPRWYRLWRETSGATGGPERAVQTLSAGQGHSDPTGTLDIVVGPRAVLGKQSECDVVCQALPSPQHDLITGTISREHAVLIWLDNRLHILDQSSNGTFIDERRVGSRLSALPDGSVLRLGQHLAVRVSLLSGESSADPPPGALLQRTDAYAPGVPPTLMLWQPLAVRGSPLERLGGALRYGQVWVAHRELWWSGHPTVLWQRQDHSSVLGPAPLRDGDLLVDRDVVLRVQH